jgi:hypothetical protein
MLQATVCDGGKFDASAFREDRLGPAEVDVCWRQVVTLPSAEDVPSLAELARWSSPQPAEPIMATLWPMGYSAAATLSNYRSLGRTSPLSVEPLCGGRRPTH